MQVKIAHTKPSARPPITSWDFCSRGELRRALEEIGDRLKAADLSFASTGDDIASLGAQLASIAEHLKRQSGDVPNPVPTTRYDIQLSPAGLYQQCLELREHLLLMEIGLRQDAVTRVNLALGQLRTCTTYESLSTALPRAVVTLGFGRALFSRVSRMQWIAEAGFSSRSADEGRRMVDIGSRPPFRELRGLFEHDVVVGRQAIIGSAARSIHRVHPELHAAIQSPAYVAAPIEVGSHVIGFVSADQSSRSGSVDDFDRELLSILCRGTGMILEQMAESERQAVMEGPSGRRRSRGDRPQAAASRYVGPDLTNRESEVGLLITRGMTNKEIAKYLTIAETTAKIHVKNVLQKLGAANRTEAAALLLTSQHYLPLADGQRSLSATGSPTTPSMWSSMARPM